MPAGAVVESVERCHLQVPDELAFGAYHDLLSCEEREYCAMPSEAHMRRDRLLARALVRTTLALYCGDGVRYPPDTYNFVAHRRHAFKLAVQRDILSRFCRSLLLVLTLLCRIRIFRYGPPATAANAHAVRPPCMAEHN